MTQLVRSCMRPNCNSTKMPPLTVAQQQVPLDLYQSKRKLITSWSDRCVEVVVVVPRVPVPSTSTSCVHDALHKSPQAGKYESICEEIMATATFSAKMDGADGHYGNRRYDATMIGKADHTRSTTTCGGHNGTIDERAHTNTIGK